MRKTGVRWPGFSVPTSGNHPEQHAVYMCMESIVRVGLVLAAAFVPVLAVACSGQGPAEGTITGHLYAVGGPAPGLPRPLPGTVTLTGPGVRRDVPVGAGGAYSVTIPAGRYTVTGHSPLYGSGAYLCRAAGAVIVTSGHTARADVLCQMVLRPVAAADFPWPPSAEPGRKQGRRRRALQLTASLSQRVATAWSCLRSSQLTSSCSKRTDSGASAGRPTWQQVPPARPPRASLTPPAPCSLASPRCSRLARCPPGRGLARRRARARTVASAGQAAGLRGDWR